MKDLPVQLKVCEGCGALWLRASAASGVYCRICRGRFAQFPAARGLRAPSTKRRRGRHPAAPNPVAPNPNRLTVMAGGAR